MKLIFISNLYPPASVGGYEQSCFDVARGLIDRGHVVNVVTSSWHATEINAREPGVDRVLKISRVFKNRASLSLDVHNCRALRNLLRQHTPDAVVVWNAANLGRGLLSVAAEHAPIVFCLGDLWLAPLLPPLLRFDSSSSLLRAAYAAAMRVAYRPFGQTSADRLVFVSESLMNDYRRAGADVRNGVVIDNGVDPAKFPFRRQRLLENREGEPFRLLFAGRLVREKGVETLVRALPLIRSVSYLRDVRLSLLGRVSDPSYGEQLRQLVNDLGIADSIDFLGHESHDLLSAVHAKHDLFVFPSSWSEPFGLSLIEAMASGMPVVATAVGAPKNIVRDGETGLLCQPNSPEDLAKKVIWMLQNPFKASDMGFRASYEVHQLYTLESRVAKFESYLQRNLPSLAPAWAVGNPA